MVGESQNRIRQVIKLAEAIAPVIFFIDEVDKAFVNIASGIDGDSGTSQRVFGTLLTWMQGAIRCSVNHGTQPVHNAANQI
jgi:SpoVK/Ycf46/Vps4 family AAA+-type ATPase